MRVTELTLAINGSPTDDIKITTPITVHQFLKHLKSNRRRTAHVFITGKRILAINHDGPNFHIDLPPDPFIISQTILPIMGDDGECTVVFTPYSLLRTQKAALNSLLRRILLAL